MKSVFSPLVSGLSLITGLVFGSLAPADAAILADYDFDGNTASGDPDANSTATNFISNYPSDSGLSGAGNYFVRVEVTPAVPTTDHHFSFTVTAASGLSLNLTNLTFRMAMVDNSAVSYSGTVFVRSSVDNFAADIGSFSQASTSGSTFSPQSVDLAGAAYQDLSSVEFRFYHYDDTDSDASSAIVHRIDDVVLNGSAIPEPASLALFGLGGLSMLIRRRR